MAILWKKFAKVWRDSINLMINTLPSEPAILIYYWQEGMDCLAVKIGSEYMQGPSDYFKSGRLSKEVYNDAVHIINCGVPKKENMRAYSTEIHIQGRSIISVIDLFEDLRPIERHHLMQIFVDQFNGPPIVRFPRI